jgi:hypothetical protein
MLINFASLFSLLLVAVHARSSIPPKSRVLFVSTSSDSTISQAMAAVAEILKVRNNESSVLMVAYRSCKEKILKSLSKEEIRVFKHQNSSFDEEARAVINSIESQVVFRGFHAKLGERLKNYDNETLVLKKVAQEFKPSLVVIDIWALR